MAVATWVSSQNPGGDSGGQRRHTVQEDRSARSGMKRSETGGFLPGSHVALVTVVYVGLYTVYLNKIGIRYKYLHRCCLLLSLDAGVLATCV